MAEGGPDLLAGDDVMVAVAHGARLERREVGARAGLGVPLDPEILAVVHTRQEALLLGVGTEAQQDRRAHAHAERHDGRAPRGAALLLEDVALHDGPVRAAPLLGPAGRDPPLLRELLVPAEQVVLRQLTVVENLVAHADGHIRADPGPDLVAERGFFGRVVQVHRVAPLRGSGPSRAAGPGWPAVRRGYHRQAPRESSVFPRGGTRRAPR